MVVMLAWNSRMLLRTLFFLDPPKHPAYFLERP